MNTDCIVIGAGASGLMAAHELVKGGCTVEVLEARNRLGGRIYTIPASDFSRPVEGGAEFIHGDLPVTQSLLGEAGISCHQMEGNMYQLYEGKLTQQDFFEEEWKLLLEALHKIRKDVPMQKFLNDKFPGDKYHSLRSNIKKFVEGYNAADITKASAKALRNEWSAEEDPVQKRPEGGYGKLMDHLADKVKKHGALIHLNETVTNISWQKDEVIVSTSSGKSYKGKKGLISVPVGVLHNRSIRFDPPIRDHENAADNIGFGSVIKFLFEFREPFWEMKSTRKLRQIKFIFSDAFVPTWWSQMPDETPLLTGWLGGPLVQKLNQDASGLLNEAMRSLAYIFDCTDQMVLHQLKAARIDNWHLDPFARGAYSYATLNTEKARKVLQAGVYETLYFAGEALDPSTHTGTVEAALASGRETALRILEGPVTCSFISRSCCLKYFSLLMSTERLLA